MEKVYKKFCTNAYFRTSGFIPILQPGLNLHPGDYFQIRNNDVVFLGNIYKDGIIKKDQIRIDYNVMDNAFVWDFHEDMSKQLLGREVSSGDSDSEYNRQVFKFKSQGSYAFRGKNPASARIANWGDIHMQLIIKMTQTLFSFRELYLVTDSITFSEWSLAISGAENAELTLVSEASRSNQHIFGDIKARMVHSRDMEYFNQSTDQGPFFFKAKKLIVQEERHDYIISQLISRRLGYAEWGATFFDGHFRFDKPVVDYTSAHSGVSVLDLMQANQLSPNTALDFFNWTNANMDDIEKMFA